METWDLVKLYVRALKSEHYIEAMSVGYQMLEFIFEILLTKTTVGKDGIPLSKSKVRNADYLLKKARLAKEYGFISEDILHDVEEFNKIRRDVIHNMVEKSVNYSEIERCAKMVSPIYGKVQNLFLTITVGEPQNA